MASVDAQVTYDREGDVHRAKYEWGDGVSLSEFVVESVAAVTNTPPTEITPLYRVIDPDALNKLYEPTYDQSLRRGGGCITFTFEGCTVTVYWDGEIEIEPPDEP